MHLNLLAAIPVLVSVFSLTNAAPPQLDPLVKRDGQCGTPTNPSLAGLTSATLTQTSHLVFTNNDFVANFTGAYLGGWYLKLKQGPPNNYIFKVDHIYWNQTSISTNFFSLDSAAFVWTGNQCSIPGSLGNVKFATVHYKV